MKPRFYTVVVTQERGLTSVQGARWLTPELLEYGDGVLEHIAHELDRELLTASGYVSPDRVWFAYPTWRHGDVGKFPMHPGGR